MIVRSHPLPCLPRASGTRLYARGETSSKCFTRRVETQPHFAMTTTTTTTTTNLEDLSTSSLEGLYALNLEPRGTGRDFSVMAMPKVRSLMDEAFPESPQRCTGQAATGASWCVVSKIRPKVAPQSATSRRPGIRGQFGCMDRVTKRHLICFQPRNYNKEK